MLLWRLLFSIFVFAAFGAISYNIPSRIFSPTGDEPHYLVITHSLAMDGDISLLNNYQGQHYRIFYDSILAKRTTASADKKLELPTFALGMPLFLAPWYETFYYRAPHKLVAYLRLVICFVAALGVFQLVSLGLDVSGRRSMPFLITAAVAFASPLITYSSQFYPEIFAFLLLVTALRILYNRKKHPRLAVISLCVIPAMLMWFHPKYLALATVLTAITTYFLYLDHDRKISVKQIVYVIIAFAGIATFLIFLQIYYGSWSPNRIYGGWQKQNSLIELFRQEGFERIGIMAKMFFGFWFDERFGLLPFAPIYVAFFTAAVWAVKNRRYGAFPPLALFILHFIPLCWGAPLGGYAPPARHFVVMLPLMLAAIFLIAGRWSKAQRALFTVLSLWSFYITFRMFANYRKIFANVTWRNPDGGSEFWPLLHLEKWIPNCIATNPEYLLIAVWTAAAIVFAVLLMPRARSRKNSDEVFIFGTTDEHR